MNVINNFFDVVPNSLKNYLVEKFFEKKKLTRDLISLTIFFYIKMIYDIYKGYSKGLKLTNIFVCMPLTSLIFELLIPFFLTLYFISSTRKQKNEAAPKSTKLYFFKASCCLQVYFYIMLTVLVHLISIVNYDIFMDISVIICGFIAIVFFILYLKDSILTKALTTTRGYAVITLLYIIYGICIQMLTSVPALTFDIIIIVGAVSFASYLSVWSMDSIKEIKDIDVEKTKKYFVAPDSLFFCMTIIIVLSIIGGALYTSNLEDSGKNALSLETTYAEIESPIDFKSHKDADGYLLFTTISQKHIAIAYQKCDKNGKTVKNAKGNYIKILKGYKYVNLNNLEISEHNYIVKVDK